MIINRLRLGVFSLALLFLCAGSGTIVAFAQTSTEGAIAGTVQDSSGAVVGGASVVIHNLGTNAEFKLTTDGSGFF